MIAILDIDGVLADATHRQHLVTRRPKDWSAFFAAVGQDPVIDRGRARLLALAAEHDIVLLSGRPESCRADTLEWLARNGMGTPRLVLRPDPDHRPAAVLKAQLVADVGTPEQVVVVIDDDATVVRRLADLGYPTELFD